MRRKYDFIGEPKLFNGHKLHHIIALRDFSDVKEGDCGGWIEKKSNLSHSGKCWVYNGAKVMDNAKVMHDAAIYDTATIANEGKVYGKAQICDTARVLEHGNVGGNAIMYGNSLCTEYGSIKGDAHITDNATVMEFAHVEGKARLYRNCMIYGSALVTGDAIISGSSEIYENANICQNACISEHAHVYGNAIVRDWVYIRGYVNICGKVRLKGNFNIEDNIIINGNISMLIHTEFPLTILGNAIIKDTTDYIIFKNWWKNTTHTSEELFIWTRSNNKYCINNYGCITGNELINKAYKNNIREGDNYKKIVDYVNSIITPTKTDK